MKTTKTERGFLKGEFIDRYNQQCSIQESSLATDTCIWFGVDVDLNGKEIHARMHLTREMVKELLPTLKHFVKTGMLLTVLLLSSCSSDLFTCQDYANGKGRHNRQHANEYRLRFRPQTNFMKANPIPKI